MAPRYSSSSGGYYDAGNYPGYYDPYAEIGNSYYGPIGEQGGSASTGGAGGVGGVAALPAMYAAYKAFSGAAPATHVASAANAMLPSSGVISNVTSGGGLLPGGGAGVAAEIPFGPGGAGLGQVGAEVPLGPGGSVGGLGTEMAPGIGYAPYLGLAGAGLSAYGLANAIKKGKAGAGAMSGAGLGLGLGTAAPLLGFGPLGWGALGGMALGGALLGGGASKLFHHKTTREYAKDKTKELQGVGGDNKAWQDYVNGMRAQYDSAPPDPSKPYHGGQYRTFDEYKKAGLDAADLTGVYGNMKAFGPKWAGMTQDQRQKITQALIDNNLYYSKKGDVQVSDEKKAQELGDQVLAGKYQFKTPDSGGGNNKIGGAFAGPAKPSGPRRVWSPSAKKMVTVK